MARRLVPNSISTMLNPPRSASTQRFINPKSVIIVLTITEQLSPQQNDQLMVLNKQTGLLLDMVLLDSNVWLFQYSINLIYLLPILYS